VPAAVPTAPPAPVQPAPPPPPPPPPPQPVPPLAPPAFHPPPVSPAHGIEGALSRAVGDVSRGFTRDTVVAIVYVAAEDRDVTDFISGELEHLLHMRGFTIVDRSELERIREEQRLGLTGEVDDNTAARIGHFAGANVVLTGRVDGSGALRRLRLRALDTTTARVVGTASEAF